MILLLLLKFSSPVLKNCNSSNTFAMPRTEDREDAFLWINTDATNLLSRDHSTSTNSFVRRAKHHKKWKLSKLQASRPRTFPWTYRPEGRSSAGLVPLDEGLTAGSTGTSTPRVHTQQSPTVAALRPRISDQQPQNYVEAVHLWGPPRNDTEDQGTTLINYPWHVELYDFDVDAQTPLSSQQRPSQFESSPDIDDCFHDTNLYAPREAPGNFGGDFAHLNQTHNDRSPHWHRQTIQDQDSQTERQNNDLGTSYTTNHIIEDSSLPDFTSFPGFTHLQDQTINTHAEPSSIDARLHQEI